MTLRAQLREAAMHLAVIALGLMFIFTVGDWWAL